MFIVPILGLVLLGIPFWFLWRKAGLSPYWVLLFLLAPFGAWISFPLLALRAWPSRGELPNPYFFAVPQNILLVGVHLILPVFSLYVIFRKTGLNGWWCLSVLLPPLAILMLWVAAFKKTASAHEVGQ